MGDRGSCKSRVSKSPSKPSLGSWDLICKNAIVFLGERSLGFEPDVRAAGTLDRKYHSRSPLAVNQGRDLVGQS